MVINFPIIPFEIQKEIAERMHLPDLLSFQECSKDAYNLGNLSKKTLDVKTMNGLCFDNRSWEKLKTHADCPRLSVKEIYINDFYTNEILAEIIEDKRIIGRKAILYFVPPKTLLDLKLFNQFLQALVTKFHQLIEFDPIYIRQPQFQMLEDIYLTSPFAIEDLVALRAPKMKITTDSANINAELNDFFTEWFLNKRKITSFDLQAYKDVLWEDLDHLEIFRGLPVAMIWSPETHNSSILSNLSSFDLECWTLKERSFFSLDIGSKKLYMTTCKNNIFAKEVTDPKRELVSTFALNAVAFQKITGRCGFCQWKDCTCPPFYYQ